MTDDDMRIIPRNRSRPFVMYDGPLQDGADGISTDSGFVLTNRVQRYVQQDVRSISTLREDQDQDQDRRLCEGEVKTWMTHAVKKQFSPSAMALAFFFIVVVAILFFVSRLQPNTVTLVNNIEVAVPGRSASDCDGDTTAMKELIHQLKHEMETRVRAENQEKGMEQVTNETKYPRLVWLVIVCFLILGGLFIKTISEDVVKSMG